MRSVNPSINLFWDKTNATNFSFDKNQKSLFLSKTKDLPFEKIKSTNWQVFIFGDLFIEKKVSIREFFDNYYENSNTNCDLEILDGQFLIFFLDRKRNEISIINDRFASIPCYWHNSNSKFISSLCFSDIVKKLRFASKFDENIFFELFYLQKIQYDHTLSPKIKFLLPSSCLKVSKNRCEIFCYWRQNFKKEEYSNFNEAGEKFTRLLQNSISKKTKNKKVGIFLSGGHDSRTILGFLNKINTKSFTVSFFDNYEVSIARQLSYLKKIDHNFIKLDDDHFTSNIQIMSELCSGQYSFINSLFVNLKSDSLIDRDILVHGYGLDFLFHGMYLPTKVRQFFGSPTFFKRLINLSNTDLVNFYLKNINFRLSSISLLDFVKNKQKKRVWDHLVESTNKVYNCNRKIVYSEYDNWDYFVTHAMSRHYSYPNVLSLMSLKKQATVVFSNEVFDFFLSLPVQYRIYGDLLIYALKKKCKKMLWIPTANYGIPPVLSPTMKTLWLVCRKILRHVTGYQKFRAPHSEDRTWPDYDSYIMKSSLNKVIKKLPKSEILRENLNFLDWKKIEFLIDETISGNKSGGKFLFTLLSINNFLKDLES